MEELLNTLLGGRRHRGRKDRMKPYQNHNTGLEKCLVIYITVQSDYVN